MARETKEEKAARLALEEEARAAREQEFRRGLPLRLLKLAARAEGLGVTVSLVNHENLNDVEVRLTLPPTEEALERARKYSERAYQREYSVSLNSESWDVERAEESLDDVVAERAEAERKRQRKQELLSGMSDEDKKLLGLS